MAYRWQSKQLLRTSLAALSCAILVPLLVAGCQSNAQQDLVARELRMQEDQIYALEDYLDEYQQLICKYRMENAALRRQLGDVDDDALPAPRPSARERNGTAPTTNGPAIEAPPPRFNGQPQQPLELPEVPPLEETTSSDVPGEAALAAGESQIDSDAVTPAAAIEPVTSKRPIHDVWLHGEVVENHDGGGPRLVVEVEPRDFFGRAVDFNGNLSLMLLANDGDGGHQSLARWDFTSGEVQSAIDSTTDKHVVRFHLELPADTPTGEEMQIWTRLVPQDGEKLLAHAAIDLQEPGQFSSRPQAPSRPKQLGGQPAIAVAQETPAADTSSHQSDTSDGGWTIARPGEPAKLADASDEATGAWRASSEPMPLAVANNRPTHAKPRVSRPAPEKQKPKAAVALVREAAAWSPDRPREESGHSPRMATTDCRPRWSATR